MKLNDHAKKILTEQLLGEKLHEDVSSIYHPQSCTCGVEYGEDSPSSLLLSHIEENNRTFTSPADIFDCMKTMVKQGKWDAFDEWAWWKWRYSESVPSSERDYIPWLLLSTDTKGDPQFCSLVYDAGVSLGWWKE